MKPNIILCLTLGLMILPGVSFADEPQPTHSLDLRGNPPSQHLDLKVVIEPSRPDIHVKHDLVSDYFKQPRPLLIWVPPPPQPTDVIVKLRVENPTAVDQYVVETTLSWPELWHSSNPEIIWTEPWGSANGLVSVKIPPGGSLTHDLKVYLDNKKPILGNKVSFRLGYNPGSPGQIFWSNEVELRVVDDTPYSTLILAIIGATLGIILVVAMVWWTARRVFQRR